MKGPHNSNDNPADDEQRKEELLREFAALPAEEQRRRTAFEPVYRDFYNELVQPNVELRVPAYFMKHWAPHLSNGATVLYLYLRMMCFYDLKNPQNTRDYCWPSQKTLSAFVGGGERSIRRYLGELEENDLIRRKPTYHYDRDKGKRMRGVDVYQVPYELPLRAKDLGKAAVHEAEEILAADAERAERLEIIEETPTGQNGPQIDLPTGQIGRQVENRTFAPPTGQSGQGTARPKWPTELVPEVSNAHNVTNVGVTTRTESESNRTRSAFSQDPRVQGLSRSERDDRESLVLELGDWLHRKTGGRTTENHKSAGAHRRAVYFAGPNLVREAMRLLDDRIEAGTAGRKEWVRNPSATFWGILRNLAADKGVSLDPVGETPSDRENEAVARAVEAPAAVSAPTERSVGGSLAPDAGVEDATPEARARVWADHLYAFHFRLEHERDPRPEEIEQAYQERLVLYRAQQSNKPAPSRRL